MAKPHFLEPGPVLGLPPVTGCVAWLELRHFPEPHAEDAYDTVFGEVVSAQADARAFAAGRWSFRDGNAELHTLHPLGGGVFAVPSCIVRAAPAAQTVEFLAGQRRR